MGAWEGRFSRGVGGGGRASLARPSHGCKGSLGPLALRRGPVGGGVGASYPAVPHALAPSAGASTAERRTACSIRGQRPHSPSGIGRDRQHLVSTRKTLSAGPEAEAAFGSYGWRSVRARATSPSPWREKIIASIFVIGLAACGIGVIEPLRSEGGVIEDADSLAGRVTHVVDGDTFRISSIDLRVRVWGLDAPETGTDGGTRRPPR